jgi:hypothetical protein
MSGTTINKARVSTATAYGLVQAYVMADLYLRYFVTKTEKLLEDLEDVERRDSAIFMLQKGSQALNCLDCLDARDLELLRTYLVGLAYDLFRQAENA